MQNHSQYIAEAIHLRVVLIPTQSSENPDNYQIVIENVITGETQVLETLDAFEEHIAHYVGPLFME